MLSPCSSFCHRSHSYFAHTAIVYLLLFLPSDVIIAIHAYYMTIYILIIVIIMFIVDELIYRVRCVSALPIQASARLSRLLFFIVYPVYTVLLFTCLILQFAACRGIVWRRLDTTIICFYEYFYAIMLLLNCGKYQ